MASEVQAKTVQETFHFINDPADAINDALYGLTRLKPDLSYNAEYKVVYRSDLSSFSKDHVTTIGFAGGGHEPMFGGFVGNNYLSAYVSGNIFASPTAAQIFEAIKMCQPSSGNSMGTLVVCGNYTGDVSNHCGKRMSDIGRTCQRCCAGSILRLHQVFKPMLTFLSSLPDSECWTSNHQSSSCRIQGCIRTCRR